MLTKQGRIHGYLSRLRLGRGSNKSLQALKQQSMQRKLDDTDQATDRPMDRPMNGHSDLQSRKHVTKQG